METGTETAGSGEATGTETLSANETGSGVEQTPASGDAQPGGGESSGDEGEQGDNDLFVKGEDGKEYIPREAFEARIGKLSAQKNDARSLIDSLRNDPVVRKEFMESLNLEEARATSPNETNEPSTFDKWLAPLAPEHQAHYRGMMEAIAPQFEEFVKTELEKALGPVRSWIGESKVDSFSKANPDFSNFQGEISKIIQSGRAKSLEDAYKIASFDKKMKSVMSAGAKSEADRQKKLTRTPVAGKGQMAFQTGGKKPATLRDALERAASDVGWGQ